MGWDAEDGEDGKKEYDRTNYIHLKRYDVYSLIMSDFIE